VYHKWFDNGEWLPTETTFEGMGGIVTQDITAVSEAPEHLDVLVIGTGSNCHVKSYDAQTGGWTPSLVGYDNLGGVCLSGVGKNS
jgi:hypothetical protein